MNSTSLFQAEIPPNRLYNLLGSEYEDSISWQHIHIFWGDERCVPKDHPDSNYTMAYNNLISKIAIPNKYLSNNYRNGKSTQIRLGL